MTDGFPLFPLHTVLFPGGTLPLRSLEARCLDMVSGSARLAYLHELPAGARGETAGRQI